jgi:hypothetical protein
LTAGVCIIHLIRNTFRYASRKYWDKISYDLKPIYTAPSAADARRAYEEFAEKWGRAYPAIKTLWDNAWEEFIPFLDYGGCRRMRSGQCSVRPRSSPMQWCCEVGAARPGLVRPRVRRGRSSSG